MLDLHRVGELCRGDVLLVANPTSGRGRAESWMRRCAQALREDGRRVLGLCTARRGDAERAGHQVAEGVQVLAIGGDGTLNELVQGLAHRDVPLSILPAGTGNVVARELGIPRRFRCALRMARTPHRRRLDVGRVADRRFLFMVSAGLDACVVERVAGRREGTMRLWDYVPEVARARRIEEPRFRVEADGEALGGACWAAVMNVSRYAAYFPLCPRASMEDGRLELLLLRDPIGPRLPHVLWKALRGRLEELPDALRRPVESVRLEGAPFLQVDGDPHPQAGAIEVVVEPRAVIWQGPLAAA